MDEHGGRCSDGPGEGCPICRGEPLSPEFVAQIEAAAAQPRLVMTHDEFEGWLDSL